MKKNLIVRALISLIIIIAARSIFIYSLDKINLLSTHYLKAINNQINIDENFEFLYVIDDLKGKTSELDVYINTDHNDYTLFIRRLLQDTKIYVNNQLYSQNIEKHGEKYNQNFSYQTINIKDSTHIRIEGSKFEELEFFIAKKNTMDEAIERRIGFYTILFCLNVVFVLFFCIRLFNGYRDKYLYVLILIGLTSIVKTIGLGELPFLAKLLNINIRNYDTYQNVTTFINSILSTILLVNLFDMSFIKRNKKKIYIGLCIVVVLLLNDFYSYYSLVFIGVVLVNIVIIVYGTIHRKEYYKEVMLNGIVSFGFIAYYLSVLAGIFKTGVLIYYTNTGYIGTIFYLAVFLVIFLNKYKNERIETNNIKKEYERMVLLRGINHDFKLPLSVIKISSQMIETGKLKDIQIKEFANDITNEVNSLEKMINNVNTFFEIGSKERREYSTNIKVVLKRIEKEFRLLNDSNKYSFKVLYNNDDYFVSMDEVDLYRILYNILDNAFKYCNAGDDITVKYAVDKGLTITVEDTGSGIQLEKIHKICTLFFRTDNSRSKEGLGIGLSVVKSMLDKYGGDITIQSEIGKGTKVIIQL